MTTLVMTTTHAPDKASAVLVSPENGLVSTMCLCGNDNCSFTAHVSEWIHLPACTCPTWAKPYVADKGHTIWCAQ